MSLSSYFSFSFEGTIEFISFLRRFPQECLCFGSSPLPGPYPAEDIPAGLLLCDYRNWHQSTRCFIGEQICSHYMNMLLLHSFIYLILYVKTQLTAIVWEKMTIFLCRKLEMVIPLLNWWQQFFLPKNRTIIMICRSVTLTLHTYKHIFAKSVSNLEISSIILPLYLLMSYSIWLQQSYQPYPCPSYVLLGHCTCNMILNIYALLQRTLCFFPQTV